MDECSVPNGYRAEEAAQGFYYWAWLSGQWNLVRREWPRGDTRGNIYIRHARHSPDGFRPRGDEFYVPPETLLFIAEDQSGGLAPKPAHNGAVFPSGPVTGHTNVTIAGPL